MLARNKTVAGTERDRCLFMTGKLGHPCREPRCAEIVEDITKHFCEAHKENEAIELTAFSRKHKPRDAFYSSARWLAARKHKLALNPVCELCNRQPATEVHHIIPKDERPDLALALSNLQSTDRSCHARESQKQSMQVRRGVRRVE